jgi:hypothetical protein
MSYKLSNKLGLGFIAISGFLIIIPDIFIQDCETRSLKGAQENLKKTILKSYIQEPVIPLLTCGIILCLI